MTHNALCNMCIVFSEKQEALSKKNPLLMLSINSLIIKCRYAAGNDTRTSVMCIYRICMIDISAKAICKLTYSNNDTIRKVLWVSIGIACLETTVSNLPFYRMSNTILISHTSSRLFFS